MRPKVFIPEPMAPGGIELLRAHCDCVIPWEQSAFDVRELGTTGFKEILYTSDAVIVRLFEIEVRDLERAGKLKVIAKHGVGVDNIDCEAAAARGIPVLITPMANANAVAEHALTLMLALSRNTLAADASLRIGQFERERFLGVELTGRTLGIVGLGRIGSRVAKKAACGFSMRVLAYDPYVDRDAHEGPAVFVDELDALLASSDFVSMHVPLTDETHHMIDADRLAAVRPGCRLINTSRGAVIDEPSLAGALREGRLAGIALDVFETEPLPVDHPFCHLPNTLLTPHVSASTEEAMRQMSIDAAQGVLDVLHGRPPQWVV